MKSKKNKDNKDGSIIPIIIYLRNYILKNGNYQLIL